MNDQTTSTLIKMIADRDAEIRKLLDMIDDLNTPVTEFYQRAGWHLIRKDALTELVNKANKNA